MKKTTTVILGIFIGFFVGIVVVTYFGDFRRNPKISEIYGETKDERVIKIGSPAPDFHLESLNGFKGLSDYRGKIVIINFWATWCEPCRIEMPIFQSYQDDYSDDLVIIAINSQDTKEDIQEFVRDLNLTFDFLVDKDGEVQKQYLVRGFPTTFFLNRKGILEIQHIGILTEDQLQTYLNALGF
jgi:thiol-disulfide isomerase/thioredoxin